MLGLYGLCEELCTRGAIDETPIHHRGLWGYHQAVLGGGVDQMGLPGSGGKGGRVFVVQMITEYKIRAGECS
mgnify:CR=1 FL=1